MTQSTPPIRTLCCLAALAVATAACGRDTRKAGGADTQAARADSGTRPAANRGAGLEPAALPPTERAQVYAAAVSAFLPRGQAVNVLVNPATLPPTGYDPGPALPPDVVKAMLRTRTFRGVCKPPPAAGQAPVCDTRQPGYVVRFADVFRGHGDTLQTYSLSERFQPSASGRQSTLPLEMRFHLLRLNGRWTVVRSSAAGGS